MSKYDWVEMFRNIGLSDGAMARWHQEFEAKYPEDHQSFLEWLNIPEKEIKSIRASS